ncbi:MAG TPA: DNA primase [Solirubrobacteraceae bacterium]|nr:DNA primase [Solirubrobacteraceae bacterium]
MSRYTADSRDRVLDAVDMVALVSTRTDLQRRGVDSYFGRCPFHDERTGSFHVRPERKHYHCFGCQASGDPFTFVMETEGLDFKGALESLAGRFGVKLETEDEDPEAAARRQRRERMYSLLDRAATYYSRYLWEAGEATAAREYLLGRGLEEQTLREFRVGYAPSAWDRILLASRRSGFSDEELLAVGLAQRSRNRPGSVYDRFRERIMFPAVDARGRVHGFGARRMRENQGGAKYLNTSDGELYHKREVLFGIDLARSAAAKTGRMILVEGYTDVLALHQAGIRNSVGIMGTSLTEEQVGELERVVKVLELCLDADRAGQEAMLRAARVAAGRRLELRVVPLPEGQDPADQVEREGADALRTRVESSQAFVAFNVDHILDRADTRSAEGKDRALGELRPMIRELGGSVLHDDLLRRIAGRLELTFAQAAALASDVSAPRATPPAGAPGRPSNGSGGEGGAGPTHTVRSERLFLGVCIAVPDSGARALNEIEIDELLTSAPLRRAARHLASHVRTPLAELPAEDDELARTMSSLVDLAGRVPDPSPDRLEHARLILELERLDRAIIRARHEGAGTSQLARDREAVRESMHTVVARLESTL